MFELNNDTHPAKTRSELQQRTSGLSSALLVAAF